MKTEPHTGTHIHRHTYTNTIHNYNEQNNDLKSNSRK